MQSRLLVIRCQFWANSGRLLNKNVTPCGIGGNFTMTPRVVATERASRPAASAWTFMELT
jgi:hypothetical protein